MKEHPRCRCQEICGARRCLNHRGLVLLYALVVVVIFLLWQSMTKYRFLRTSFIPLSGLVAPVLMSDLSEGQIYLKLQDLGISVPRGGCVWDIGANNGVWNSNSFYLINYLNYTAVLFEPEAEVFLSLRKRYAGSLSPLRGRVTLFNAALLKAANVLEYRVFPAALESTLMKGRRQYDPTPDYTYQIAGADARIVCDQQKDYIQHNLCGADAFTVLSIDAEGADRLIFSRIHEVGCSFDIVIIEAAGDIVEFMKAMGYVDIFHSGYNVIFRHAK